MENLPIEKGFAIVRWWIGLKAQDKLIAFLLAVIISVSTVATRLYSTNSELQRENLAARVECEQRLASSVQWQRNRDDSLNAIDARNWEIEKQEIYNRVDIIKKRNDKLQKAIK